MKLVHRDGINVSANVRVMASALIARDGHTTVAAVCDELPDIPRGHIEMAMRNGTNAGLFERKERKRTAGNKTRWVYYPSKQSAKAQVAAASLANELLRNAARQAVIVGMPLSEVVTCVKAAFKEAKK